MTESPTSAVTLRDLLFREREEDRVPALPLLTFLAENSGPNATPVVVAMLRFRFFFSANACERLPRGVCGEARPEVAGLRPLARLVLKPWDFRASAAASE
mmetsp:Transcript_148205/g.261376  ORF Transcript_148205/g.261376 Transcript_148205/m.261376 type:complete len:100 (-) Transcript_148205:834-1133(-)